MLKQNYRLAQLTADNDLVRVKLLPEGSLENRVDLNALDWRAPEQISFALKSYQAVNLRLGDVFSLSLIEESEGNK